MESIILLIYFILYFIELSNCIPIQYITNGSSQGIELTTLTSICATVIILTGFLFLIGCTWCSRIFKKDAHISQAIQLGDTGSTEVVDPGILNPLNDIRFPITNPINHSVSPRSQGSANEQEVNDVILQIPHYAIDPDDSIDNNNLFENNNNGPISAQELENIVNNNAENYIVTEYENRNLSHQVQRDPLNEIQEAISVPSSSHASPRHNNVWSEYGDWFYSSGDEIARTQLQYLQVIGKGWFGRIVEGEIHGLGSLTESLSNGQVTKVAVKILDENVSVTEKCNFLRESQILKDAKHVNILKFMGKNLSQDPWFILLENCSLGDLKQYLISNKSQMQFLIDEGIPLKFILDVSSALQYLHLNNMFYDVACHNCLVTENLSVRLGDYGDAEQRYPEHFYPLRESKQLPIRWLPPEYNNISTAQGHSKENIWSFGVFMWECCSWGDTPYNNLYNEEVVRNVLCLNGVRLQEPVPNTQYTSYLYNVMQTCWNDDPILRCNASHIYEYIQNLYANFYNSTDKSFTHNFDARWETFKPNTIPKVDNSLPEIQKSDFYHINFTESVIEPDIRIIHPNEGLAYQNEAISTETLSVDDNTSKLKSDSLTNLHGSFESVSNQDSSRNLQEKNSPENANDSLEMTADISVEKSLLESGVSQVAPWLLDVPFNTPEDISYIKNVSDVINDFDNMLSSEKTSSSESSPSRVIVTSSGIDCEHDNSEVILSEDVDKISLNDSVTEISSYRKEHQSQNSEFVINNVPDNNMTSNNKDINYPTLDFRLNKLDDETIFPTSNIFDNATQELDSLQDSSYIPDTNKDNSTHKRSSSSSETEDEVWKKRVELGVITEKIKMKSKSVMDFMVLTHIDLDNTDLDSEDASYNSLENKNNAFLDVIQRRLKRNSSQLESGLAEEFMSFPRNLSSSILNQFVSLKPELDLYTLWKNCKHITWRNLRPSKSLSDLNVLNTKIVSLEELANFKKRMDSFLDISFDKSNKQNSSNCNNDLKSNQGELRHFDLNLPTGQIVNPIFAQQPHMNNYNFLSAAAEEETLNFSSNFNDLNLNLYAEDHTLNSHFNDAWDSTKYISLPDQFCIGNETNSQSSNIETPNATIDAIDDGECCAITSTPNKRDREVSNREMIIPHVSISEPTSSNSIETNENINSMVERQVDEIIRNELLNITTKLAIAENENNLNIEFSSPSSLVDEYHDVEYPRDNIIEPINFHVQVPTNSAVGVEDISQDFVGTSNSRPSETMHQIDNLVGRAEEITSHSVDNNSIDECKKLMTDLSIDSNDNIEAVNEMICMKDKIISNQLIQDLDEELEKLDAECEAAESNYFSPETSESLYENVEPNYKREKPSSSSWYLHPKVEDLEDVMPQLNAFPVNIPSSNSSSMESLSENNTSDHYTVDPESVEALRSELQLKLPLAQRITQMHHDNLGSGNSTANNDTVKTESQLPMCKPALRDSNLPKYNMVEASTSTGIGSSDISIPGQSQGKNEIMIHYSMYGIVPLSPIQEESWSEFSEMEKAADIHKTDSNSLSLGEETSNIEQNLPFDGVCDMKILDAPHRAQSKETTQDDDTYSDSSNRTFVLNDGGSCNLKRQQSLSADSLNSIEQFDDDDQEDETVPLKNDNETRMEVPQLNANTANELFSPLCDEHSHPKSTEEISQNVDNLLETISKTLENASKICTVGSDCQEQLELLNGDGNESSENSGSKTYVIENNMETVQDLKAVYDGKVAEIPDDVSNVSKVSQPSFVSDITSPDDGSDMKVSEKSMSIHSHTKTLSMESWCSNDTLFNVEENFDDGCLGELVSPINKVGVLREDVPACSSTPQTAVKFELPQMEMVMGYSENFNNQSLNEDNAILCSLQQIDKSPPEKLELSKQLLLLPEPLIENNEIKLAVVPSASKDEIDLPEENIPSDVLLNDIGMNIDGNLLSSMTPSNAIELSDASNNSETQKNESDLELKRNVNESLPEISSEISNLQNTEMELNETENFKQNLKSSKINMTSTPTTSTHNDSNSTKNSTDNVIDEHFKFLDNQSVSVGSTSDSKENSSLVLKVTNSFLMNEQKFANYCSLDTSTNDCILKSAEGNIAHTVTNMFVNDLDGKIDIDKSIENSGIETKTDDSTNKSNDIIAIDKIEHADEHNVKQIEVDPQIKIASKSIENTPDVFHSTGVNIESSPELSVVLDSNNVTTLSTTPENKDGGDNVYTSGKLDMADPLLMEYMECSGLNMGLQNLDQPKNKEDDSPSFEAFKQSVGALPQDLANYAENEYNYNAPQGLSNIQFSGPLSEDIMSTSFSGTSPSSEESKDNIDNIFRDTADIGNMAPERLKEWDSESDDSNCSSTSSAEFVWKEGDGAQLLNVPSVSYPSTGMMKQSFHGASQSFAGIPEEEEDAKSDQHDGERGDDDEDEEDEEEMDFVPSSWDCHAAPSKSALKSPDTSQIETRKRVVFKKQKYQSIYEYPRDDEAFQTLPDFSTYAEWNATNSNDFMPVDYQHYLSSHMSNPSTLSGPGCEDDFYISSSSRPFETYSTVNSSEFFPGQQFSLSSNYYDDGEYLENNEDDYFKSLPPIPTEEELRNALGNDATALEIENVEKPAVKSSDYVTPDSGTEDTSPGDVLDFENILNNKNLSTLPESTGSVDEGVDNDIENINLEKTVTESDDSHIVQPVNTSNTTTLLGGLRHTRDKLKLDLPPSPLPRNSPCLINSGKNSSKDIVVFDFKNVSQVESDEVDGAAPQFVSKSNDNSEIQKDKEKCLSSLESDTGDSDVISPNSVISVIGKFDVNNQQLPQTNDSEPANSPPAEGVLHKSVIRMQDKTRRVSLEPVKGEGTLLDSGDEDSGIGSSAYATLERKCDNVSVNTTLDKTLDTCNKPT